VEEKLDFRGEDEFSAGQLRVIEGEAEHAVEPVEAGFAPLLIDMHNDFGVAVGAKVMIGVFQLCSRPLVVIDFAIVDDE
jgi:hypothetical protein